MKRTFEFTHDQVDLLLSCLYMASSEYNREFKRLCDVFMAEENKHKMYWFEKSNKIYDFAQDIKNSKFDV